MPRRRAARPRRSSFAAAKVDAAGGMVIELPDCSQTAVALTDIPQGRLARDRESLEETLGSALLAENAERFDALGVSGHVSRSRGKPKLVLRTGVRVGALPLRSPTSGREDHGLIVRPRFGWTSVGDTLATTGFTVVPELLKLPALPRSERRVPPWVLSSVVLGRIERLLRTLRREFVERDAIRPAPHGRVDWQAYASRQIARARPHRVPCRFPDLVDDRALRGAVHHVLRVQLASLASQRGHGPIVHSLLTWCDRLLAAVADATPRIPSAAEMTTWSRQPLAPRPVLDGLEAMAWTIEETGLAGAADLSGLPWRLDMDQFFEAYVESVVREFGQRHFARVRSGRLEETRVPLDWRPRFSGSQRSLLPDVILEREGLSIVFDAKYKSHRSDLDAASWDALSDATRAAHRVDLLQILAYATTCSAERVVACLVYPFPWHAFADIRARGRALVRARLPVAGRHVELSLAALPLGGSIEDSVGVLEPLIASTL